MRNRRGDGTEQHARESFTPSSSDHQKIGVMRILDEDACRRTMAHHRYDRQILGQVRFFDECVQNPSRVSVVLVLERHTCPYGGVCDRRVLPGVDGVDALSGGLRALCRPPNRQSTSESTRWIR